MTRTTAEPTAGLRSEPDAPGLRVAVSPWYVDNKYQEEFYRALGPVVQSVTREIVIDDGWLRRKAADLDVLHFHWPERVWRRAPSLRGRLRILLGLWTYLRLARRLGIRIWWTAHNLAPHEDASFVDQLGVRLLARQADLVICHSEWSRDHVRQRFGLPAERVLTLELPPCLDVAAAAPQSRAYYRRLFGVDERVVLFACLGQVRPYKNLLASAQAVASLDRPDVRLVIAGPPHDRALAAELERFAETHGAVRVMARKLGDEEFAGLVKASDAVLLPYLRVTNSAVLVDVLSAGRPVIASRHAVFEEIAARAPGAVEFTEAPTPSGIQAALLRYIDVAATANEAARTFRSADWWTAVAPLRAYLGRTG